MVVSTGVILVVENIPSTLKQRLGIMRFKDYPRIADRYNQATRESVQPGLFERFCLIDWVKE